VIANVSIETLGIRMRDLEVGERGGCFTSWVSSLTVNVPLANASNYAPADHLRGSINESCWNMVDDGHSGTVFSSIDSTNNAQYFTPLACSNDTDAELNTIDVNRCHQALSG